VAQYLHGVEPPDQPTTAFAWREEVALLALKADADDAAKKIRAGAIEEYLDEYPLKPHEQLAERTARLVSVPNADPDETGRRQHLKEFAKHVAADLPAWLIDRRGRVRPTTIGELAESDFGALMGRTVVLPPAAGGLSTAGMLSGREPFAPDMKYDVADEAPAGGRQTRQRTVESAGDETKPLVGDRPVDADRFKRVADIPLAEGADEEPSRRFVAWVAADSLEGEQSRSRQARFRQFLDDHLCQAERYAGALAERLLPAGPERVALRLAAKWHDLGKNRDVWQRGVGNLRGERPWAKSGRKGRIFGLNSYRHEFGSLLDLEDVDEFKDLPTETQDLILHLIAAHHGRARPHFPSGEDFDTEARGRDERGMSVSVPQRFARLQRKYGRWGLAYLESLLRAADWAASAAPSEFLEDEK